MFLFYSTKKYLFVVTFAFIIVFFINACTTMGVTERFVHIALKEWIALNLFTPVILYPPPGETRLQMGPFLAESSKYVELYYTEDFVPNKIPPGYQLYESHKPLPIGSAILPKYASKHRKLVTKRMPLNLLGKEYLIEIRRNSDYPNDGVAIFYVEGTYVVYYWQNVAEDAALKNLTNSLTLVHPNDTDIIAAFGK